MRTVEPSNSPNTVNPVTGPGGRPHPPPPGVSIRNTSPAPNRIVHLSGKPIAPRLVAARQQPVLARRTRLHRPTDPTAGDTRRSVISETVTSSSISRSRSIPSPPVASPAPPLPRRNRYRNTRIGYARSNASDGRVPGVGHPVWTPDMPGTTGTTALAAADRLVVHPAAARATDEDVVHRSLRCRRRPDWAQPRERAQAHVGDPLAHLDVAGTDGDGWPRGDDASAPGAMTRTGRSAPPLAGIVGSVTDRSANDTADVVTAATALTLPARCSSVPVKSNVMSSPSIVTRTEIVADGCARARSSRARPSRPTNRRACRASAARMRRSAYSSTSPHGAPDAMIDASRSTPTAFAPTCASRSPARSTGVRELREQHGAHFVGEQHRRQPQSLLIDLGRVRGDRAGRGAADVGVVRTVRRPSPTSAPST